MRSTTRRLCTGLAVSVTGVVACVGSVSAGPAGKGEHAPAIVGVCLVAPDELAVTIETEPVTLGKVVDYVPQDGDAITIKTNRNGSETIVLKRGAVDVGDLLGAGSKRQVIVHDTYTGEPLQTAAADRTNSYVISSTDDPAYASGVPPTQVHRKTKPTDFFEWGGKCPARHVLFLRLPAPLTEGNRYRIDCSPLNVKTPTLTFRNDTRATRSLAVHNTQIGYRADDPFKRGYLSIWLGSAANAGDSGVCRYPQGLKFHLLDDASGRDVFSGSVEMAKAATDKEMLTKAMNYNGTDVLRMDFSRFSTPGRYRLYVEGIGCGYPFDIGANTWAHAFWVQMRGYYHQRSGIALGPPYSTFVKPRDHHPADGVPVFLTKATSPVWTGDKDPGFGPMLKTMATDQRMTNGWGGYHDAGDWNPRRVSHMQATMAQLEIADLFPDFVAQLKLNIPQDYKVPDLFNEALFEIDCFRRMQTPEGGVGYGLETVGDPGGYTVSWHTTVLPVYEFSPDAGNSWFYASVAARAARLLKRYDTRLAAVYEASARQAMTWAEMAFANHCKENGKTAADLLWSVRDTRNLAALEMLRLTSDHHWHDVFMENTVLTNETPNLFVWGKAAQSDAAFAYAIADEKLTDPVIRKRAIQALEHDAVLAAASADGNAFDLVIRDKYRPMFMGFYSTPFDGRVVLRAYHLTGKPEYLVAGIRATQFSSGANPENLVETTGLGANPILHPLRIDPRRSGQPAPEGITVYGIDDMVSPKDWILPAIDAVMSPKFMKWPRTESYTDIFCFVMQNEYTVNQTFTYPTWVWGYLAARPTVAKTN